MSEPLDGARILITGGTGSLGQALVRRILRGEIGTPQKIIVFSRCEAKQYAMKSTWKHAYRATDDIYYDNFEELLDLDRGRPRPRGRRPRGREIRHRLQRRCDEAGTDV